jgi:hypothetical protein
MPQHAPRPRLSKESLRQLFNAAARFLEAKPWEYTSDSHVAGWTDSTSGEIRIGSVLGNAGLIYAAVFHRRAAGLNWVFRALTEDETENPSLAEGMDCLKLEFVLKGALSKEDRQALAGAGYKRPGQRGAVWPRFQSFEPGWKPWFINQREADELLEGIPRLLKFCQLLRRHLELYDDRSPGDVPFLPSPQPERPLQLDDLEWRPLVLPPDPGMQPVPILQEEVDEIARLPQVAQTHEFSSGLFPGVSYLEEGRPALSRLTMLVDHERNDVLHVEFDKGPAPAADSAVCGLVKALLRAAVRPRQLLIANPRLQPILLPWCDAVGIELRTVQHLPAFEAASQSLSEHLRQG